MEAVEMQRVFGTSPSHVPQAIDVSRCALLVVDMQNYFVDTRYPTAVAAASATIPAINELAQFVRAGAGHVMWIRTLAAVGHDRWAVFEDKILSPEARALRQELMTADHHASQIFPAMDVRKEDLVVQKSRFSALLPQSSDLPQTLAEREIETVLIAGTATNVCCESTARDAMMLNYYPVMVPDCLSAQSEEAHNSALAAFDGLFGSVMTLGQLRQLAGHN